MPIAATTITLKLRGLSAVVQSGMHTDRVIMSIQRLCLPLHLGFKSESLAAVVCWEGVCVRIHQLDFVFILCESTRGT